jgi:lysine/arginine/ornithine transport system substrate-binding protein
VGVAGPVPPWPEERLDLIWRLRRQAQAWVLDRIAPRLLAPDPEDAGCCAATARRGRPITALAAWSGFCFHHVTHAGAPAMPSRLLALLAALVLLPAAVGAQPVRIGTEADYAPFESRGPDGRLTGFEIELGEALCARAKLDCRWVNMDFDGMIPALKAHQIDAILSQMSVTPERAREVAFTNPVTRAQAQFVAAKDSGITGDPASLSGKTLGVQSGTTHEAYARRRLGPGVEVKVYQSQEQAFADLLAGRIDATLADQAIGYYWLSKAGRTCCAAVGKPIDDPEIFGNGTAIALRPEDAALRTALNRALAAILADGTYGRINARYFPFSIAPR